MRPTDGACSDHARVIIRLMRLVAENDRVVGEEHLLGDRRQRIRDVRQGLDDSFYVVTNGPRGELWRITPRW